MMTGGKCHRRRGMAAPASGIRHGMRVCTYACMHVCMYVCVQYVCMYVQRIFVN